MSLVAALLVHGHPLPYLQPTNPPWVDLATGYRKAAAVLAEARPDVVIAYSTQWFAVLDELWQVRERCHGIHVDENWYEYGDLPFDIRSDAAIANACVAACKQAGISAKPVDYDSFPIDSGTIVMANSLDPEHRLKFVLAANNLYHDWDTTVKLGAIAAQEALATGKRVAVVGVGGLSGSLWRNEIDVSKDSVTGDGADDWNRRFLKVLEGGNRDELLAFVKDYVPAARADMGMKHLAWLLGAMGDGYKGARTLGYGPGYGSGNAVVQLLC